MKLKFGNMIKSVSKITRNEFTPYHHEVLKSMQYNKQHLLFSDDRWESVLLGAGEEKAVFCICDHNDKVFAIEIIDENHYLNGRLVNGEYFFNSRNYNIAGKKFNERSLIGLTFTGLVKIREYVYGYEWSRFQYRYDRKSALDNILTSILQTFLRGQFNFYREHYKDVHDRNVMFEISDKGIPVFYRDCDNKLRLGKVSLKAIDVR